MPIPVIFLNTPMEHQIQELERIHGQGSWTQNSKGWHISLASPFPLETEGQDELLKRHLSFNVTRAAHMLRHPGGYTQNWDRAELGYCFKTQASFCFAELLSWPPLDQRPHVDMSLVKQRDALTVTVQYSETNTVPCEVWGCRVPKLPGEVIPLTALPKGHPVLVYLASRRFTDLPLLEAHLGAGCCEVLRPDYPPIWRTSKFPITPQSRVLLQCWQRGVVFNWQARLPELNVGGYRFAWHPVQNKWVPVWQLVEGKAQVTPYYAGVKIPKYLFPAKSQKAVTLMGYDLAVRSALKDGQGRRYALLVEGAFDAARLGPPAIAIMGAYASDEALVLLRQSFDRLIYVADNDPAGLKAAARLTTQIKTKREQRMQELAPQIRFSVALLPPGYKDAGEMPAKLAQEFHQHLISQP